MQRSVQPIPPPLSEPDEFHLCSLVSDLVEQGRAPLEAVLGFADLLSQESIDRNQAEYVRTIQQQGRELQKWLGYVITYTRIQAGRLRPKLGLLAMADVVAALQHQQVEDGVANRDSILHVREVADLPEQVLSDPILLRQCLGILLDISYRQSDRQDVWLRTDTLDEPEQTYLRFSFNYTAVTVFLPSPEQSPATVAADRLDLDQLRHLVADSLANLLEGRLGYRIDAPDHSLELLIPLTLG